MGMAQNGRARRDVEAVDNAVAVNETFLPRLIRGLIFLAKSKASSVPSDGCGRRKCRRLYFANDLGVVLYTANHSHGLIADR
jgi:hypothetical protein